MVAGLRNWGAGKLQNSEAGPEFSGFVSILEGHHRHEEHRYEAREPQKGHAPPGNNLAFLGHSFALAAISRQ